MTDDEPIVADFVEIRQLNSRGVVRLTFEAPVEKGFEILQRLGGFALPHTSLPCAIVPLELESYGPAPKQIEPPPDLPALAPERHAWRSLRFVKQAGILCKDPDFQAWLDVPDEEGAAAKVRQICGLKISRTELDANPDAAAIWVRLSDAYRARRDRASQDASLMGRGGT